MRVRAAAMIVFVTLGFGGCSREQTDAAARKAGKEAHNAAREAGKAAHKAANELSEAAKQAKKGWDEAGRTNPKK